MTDLPTADPSVLPEWIDESTKEQLRREARIVGLRSFEAPSFEAVERRRLQLWALSTVLLVILSLATLLSLWWTPDLVGDNTTQIILRVSLFVLTIAFAGYSFEKETHLRRLSHLLLDERLLTIALSNRLRELSLLLEAGKAMNSVLEMPQVLESILRSSLELLKGSNGSIMLLDAASGELTTVSAWGNQHANNARQKLGRGIAGTVAANLEPLLINGVPDPDRFPDAVGKADPVHSAMCVPLVHQHECLGVLNVNAEATRSFSEYDLRALSLFAEQAASTIAKARLFEAQREQAEVLAHLALHDQLTGVANRVLFMDHASVAIARAARHPAAVAVFFIDLDGFKRVNDTHGHAVGDELLRQVARRLRSALRPSDVLARFGGDEFVVLCEGLGGEIEAVGVAARLDEALSQPIRIESVEQRVTASIGIALATGAEDDAEALVRDADTAMYRAKRLGKARYQVFNAAVRAEGTARLRSENVLRHALESGGITLSWRSLGEEDGTGIAATQPRLELVDDGVPVDLGVIDEAGLASEVAGWLLRHACDAAPTTPVVVELAACMFDAPDLPEQVAAAIDGSSLRAADLLLAIPWAALPTLPHDAVLSLMRIAAAGVGLGIVDFGAGDATAGDVRRLPVSFVKLTPGAPEQALEAARALGARVLTDHEDHEFALGQLPALEH